MMPPRYGNMHRTAGTGPSSMMAAAVVTAATCAQEEKIQKHITPTNTGKPRGVPKRFLGDQTKHKINKQTEKHFNIDYIISCFLVNKNMNYIIIKISLLMLLFKGIT